MIEFLDGYSLKWEGEVGDLVEVNSLFVSMILFGLLVMILVVVVLFNVVC